MKKRSLFIGFLLCWTVCLCAQTPTLPTKEAVKNTMKLVADWQIKDYDAGHRYYDTNWTNGALFTGMADWAELAESLDGDESYIFVH